MTPTLRTTEYKNLLRAPLGLMSQYFNHKVQKNYQKKLFSTQLLISQPLRFILTLEGDRQTDRQTG